MLIAALLLSIRKIYGEDIGFHLQAGRWMLENFSFPDKDVFTYTANANQYIDLNWLYQLFLYGVYSAFGDTGLILSNSLLIVFSVVILFKRIENTSAFLPWFLLIGIIAISPIFEIRPHSLSWLFLSVTLYILQKYYEGNEKIIRWLPAVMLLWVNSHSLFILGPAVTGCYGISIWFRDKTISKVFLKWSLLSFLVCFLNPYGWKGVYFPFEQIVALSEGNIFKENIRELQSPFSITTYEWDSILKTWHFFDLFIIVSAILLFINRKKIKLHEWAILLIFFYFAYSATKNIGYFVFAVIPILAGKKEEPSLQKNKKTKTGFVEKHLQKIRIGFAVVSIMLILSVSTNAFYIHYRASYRLGLGWSNANLPVKAVEFMNRYNIRGKILNQLDYGGYLEFFTNQKVSIDGRLDLMGEKLFNEQVNAVTDEGKNFLIKKNNPEIIIFSYFSTPDWILYLQKQSDWRLVFADETSAIYLNNNFRKDIPPFTEESILSSLTNYADAEIQQMIKNGKEALLLSSFYRPQYYPEGECNFTAFCFYYGWMKAAKQLMATAYEKSTCDYPELYQNLGSIYYEERNAAMALFCYEKYIESAKNPQVEERIRFLKTKL